MFSLPIAANSVITGTPARAVQHASACKQPWTRRSLAGHCHGRNDCPTSRCHCQLVKPAATMQGNTSSLSQLQRQLHAPGCPSAPLFPRLLRFFICAHAKALPSTGTAAPLSLGCTTHLNAQGAARWVVHWRAFHAHRAAHGQLHTLAQPQAKPHACIHSSLLEAQLHSKCCRT